MPYVLSLIGALILSMALVPLAMRMAPALGLVDVPDPRKVHAIPIPRVGGVGIVVGALGASLWWLPPDPLYDSFLLGSLVLFVFGLLDDRYQTGHYTKFIGQFIAAALVVFYGDLYVERLPFLSPHLIDPLIGRLFTLVALVGVINAANHSDGLDGLASGLTLISLSAIALMAHHAGGSGSVILALAVIGSILGFLRFNTHPAMVFMGDSGSQFLGFAAGFLVVLLTQQVNPALSPAVVALLLGLPIVDILAVFYLRASGGMNWFKATRNHIHHRFLDAGIPHQTTVILIYGVHLLFVCSAFALKYASDALILVVYGLLVSALFTALLWLERSGPRSAVVDLGRRINDQVSDFRRLSAVRYGPIVLMAALISLYLLAAALSSVSVPIDFAWFSVGLLLLAVALIASGRLRRLSLERLVVLPAAVFCLYLCEAHPPQVIPHFHLLQQMGLGLIAGAIILDLKFGMHSGFRTTTLDYLAVFLIVLVTVFAPLEVANLGVAGFALKIIVVFYGCELVLSRKGYLSSLLFASAVVTLAILSVRGFGALSMV